MQLHLCWNYEEHTRRIYRANAYCRPCLASVSVIICPRAPIRAMHEWSLPRHQLPDDRVIIPASSTAPQLCRASRSDGRTDLQFASVVGREHVIAGSVRFRDVLSYGLVDPTSCGSSSPHSRRTRRGRLDTRMESCWIGTHELNECSGDGLRAEDGPQCRSAACPCKPPIERRRPACRRALPRAT